MMPISSISALLAALTLTMGVAVVLSRRRRPAYTAFAVLCGNLFLWHLASIFRLKPAMWYVGIGLLALVPVTLLRFLRTWLGEGRTGEQEQPTGVPRPLWLLVFVVEVALVYAYSVRFASPGSARWALRIPGLVQALALLGTYVAMSPLWQAYRRTLSRVDKRRLLYLLGVGVLTVTVAAVDYLPAPIGRGEPALGSLLIIIYLYFLQQTLFLDRLLDITELLGKVVVLVAFVLLLMAMMIVMSLVWNEQQQSQVVLILVAFVLLLYEPLRSMLEAQVQRLTARERYEFKQHLDELRHSLPNVIDLREAVRTVLALFEETQRMTHASVYLVDADGSAYELAGHFGPHPADRLDAAARRPLLERLIQRREPVTLEALESERQLLPRARTTELETLDAIGRSLLELHAGAVIGIYSATSRGVGRGPQPSVPGLEPGAGAAAPAAPGTLSSPGSLVSLVSGSAEAVLAEEVVPGEVVLGLLCVKDERVSDAFAVDELGMMAGVAAQLGITLQNSKLYDRMKERDRLAALGEMAAGLAHEIRNPLGAIKGAAELVAPLPGGQIPEDAGDFLRIIVEEAKRLNRVVSQFLDYARPYRGIMEPVDLNEVVRKTCVLLPAESQGDVVLELQQELPPVRGDAEQLRQVFLNLALNGVQALDSIGEPQELGQLGPRAPRRLTISTGVRRGRTPQLDSAQRSGAQFIEVRFADNGPGMAATTLKKLFIPFYTTKEKGTGLGLPISQRIIENHGGEIEVRSRLGSGATFTVLLPLAPDTKDAEATAAAGGPGRA